MDRVCCFYASREHLMSILLPYINEKLEENQNIVTILEEDIGKSAQDLRKIFNFTNEKWIKINEILKRKENVFKENNFEDAIVIIVGKNSFLEKNIRLDMHDLVVKVRTDSKWMEFIINQIVVNSIKYTLDKPLIEIYSISDKESVSLIIRDNGIGIGQKDLPRVFEKGFTGENGRSKYNSTGMGLYLVKKLCLALGNNVIIDSTEGVGTTVKIIFPLGSFTDKMIGDEDYGIKSEK